MKIKQELFKPIKCLNHGFVRLVDYMGSDQSIVQAARVSYGKGTKKTSEDRTLIRYLMRNRHTSPFEMVELKFYIKAPLFVARHLVRHRTASANEVSARYSVLPNEFYIPKQEDFGVQSKSNKQGIQIDSVSKKEAEKLRKRINLASSKDYALYQSLLNEEEENPGEPRHPSRPMLARELARIVLPQNVYTELYWKMDLHNLFNFLALRTSEKAQGETRVYAEAIGQITKKVVPTAYNAFEDYRLNGIALSALDIQALRRVSQGEDKQKVVSQLFTNQRERKECLSKLERLLVD